MPGPAAIRLILSGQQKVVAGLESTRVAVADLQKSTAAWGKTAEQAGKRGFLLNQALFTMHRLAYGATLGFIGFTAVVAKWGFDFNNTMEEARTALRSIFPSSRALNDELSTLFDMTKKTPFQFKDVVTMFRGMDLTLSHAGVSVKVLNQTIHAMMDALSATGRTAPENLARAGAALQKVALQGRLTGITLSQLNRLGVPATLAIEKYLHVAPAQLSSISKLGISANAFLWATNKYIETTPGFMDAAGKQAKTFRGMLTTLKDNIAQVSGGLQLSVFEKGPSFLDKLNKTFDKLDPIMKRQGGKISMAQVFGVFEKTYPQLTVLINTLQHLWDLLKAFWGFMKSTLVPTIMLAFAAFAVFLNPIMWIATKALQAMSGASSLLIPILGYVTAAIIFEALWTRKLAIAQALARLAVIALGVVLKTLEFTLLLVNIALGILDGTLEVTIGSMVVLGVQSIWTAISMSTFGTAVGLVYLALVEDLIPALGLLATGIYVRVTTAIIFLSDYIVAKLIPRLILWGVTLWTEVIPGIWAMVVGLYATVPAFIAEAVAATIAWIATTGGAYLVVLAIYAVIIAVTMLYFKWKWFHDFVDTSFHWIVNHWKLLAILLVAPFFPVTAALIAVIVYFKTLVGWARTLASWLGKIKLPGWMTAIGHGIGSVAHFLIPLSSGSSSSNSGVLPVAAPTVTSGGAVIGTQPSLIGSSVKQQAVVSYGNKLNLHVHSTVNIDGKKVAESTAKHRQNVQARR